MLRLSSFFTLLTMAALLTLSSAAYAEFTMSAMVIDFLPTGAKQKDVEIRSLDIEKQYIATEINKIENPGTDQQKSVPIKDMKKSGIIVSPAKMILPGKASKLMRFITLATPTSTDQIYRVTVKPVINELDSADNAVALKILLGYEALVIVRPANAHGELVGKRSGNTLQLTNKGNTNILLQSVRQCPTAATCKELKTNRLYAGNSWTLPLPHSSAPVHIRTFDGVESKEVEF